MLHRGFNRERERCAETAVLGEDYARATTETSAATVGGAYSSEFKPGVSVEGSV